jgi:hypothetical protein
VLFWDYLGSLIIPSQHRVTPTACSLCCQWNTPAQSVLRCQTERISVEVRYRCDYTAAILTVWSCSFEHVSVISPAHKHVEGLFVSKIRPCMRYLRGGADKSLARPTLRCRMTESIA